MKALNITIAFLCALLIGSLTSCAKNDKVDKSDDAVIFTTNEELSDVVQNDDTQGNVHIESAKKLSCLYYDEPSFNTHIKSGCVYEFDGQLHCATLPHHLTAGSMISGILNTAAESRENTDTVIVVATMHYFEGDPLCTSLLDWNTPFGTMYCDNEITQQLIEGLSLKTDDDMAMQDHTISALVPYIKYYFPDSQIAFVIVSNKAHDNISHELSQILSEISEQKNCLFLFSVDFSHYLDPAQTESCDNETLKAVMAKDYERIAQMSDMNVDSPYVLSTFMRLCEELSLESVLIDHSNSLMMSNTPYSKNAFPQGLTSYFVFAG